MLKEVFTDLFLVAGIAGIAAGRLPLLRLNRVGIAFVTATCLILIGAISLGDAMSSIDLGTISLLLSMMLLVSAIRVSGLFDLVAARLSGLAGYPRIFLASIIMVAGVMSALFLNDTMCLVLAPVVAETSLRARRNPVPYLVATATASNIGSAATIIGNPQNMLIGARSGIPFADFVLHIGPPSLLGLGVCWLVIVLVFPGEFRQHRGHKGVLGKDLNITAVKSASLMSLVKIDRILAIKSCIAGAALLLGFLAGLPVVLVALIPAAFMLVSTRIKSDQLFSGVDFNLLVFFAGLFVITKAVSQTVAFQWLEQTVLTGAAASPWIFSSATALVSNVVSNVPAVMMLSPLASSAVDPKAVWLLLAMASTFAGNLTLMGSVANLIVAEGAASRGAKLGFLDYLKAGVSITVLTLIIGTAWLSL